MSDHAALCRTPLNEIERARLLGLLQALAAYLGAPGDWGYGTRLSAYTQQTLEMCAAVRNADVPKEQRHAQ